MIASVLDTIGEGLANAFLMAWQVWWALVLGFAISALVQAWVPRERIQHALGSGGARSVSMATGLGAASSSCSYAAVAIARSLLAGGASAASALAFQFASTNLVVELGVLLWVLLGWQFTAAEFLGGLLMIIAMSLLLRLFVSRRLEGSAREHARAAVSGHEHHSAGGGKGLRERLGSLAAWSDVAHNFRNDWAMLYREIAVGFLLAGFIGLLGNDFFNSLFITSAPAPLRVAENVLVGPLIAVLSFVCSIGNVPLAAVLWSGGIGFAGVISFLFADLIVLPIIVIYRRYYGRTFARRIVALMLLTMIFAAVAVSGLFSLAGLTPTARPTHAEIFEPIQANYKLVLNILAAVVFAALLALTMRRGATDPVCGMKVDRQKALKIQYDGRAAYLCSQQCADALAARHGAGSRLSS